MDAVKLNSVQFTLARAIGPGFAGVVVATWGTGAAILINAITFPLVIAVLVMSSPRENSVASRSDSVKDALIDGGKYMWSHRPIRLAVFVGFFAACCGQSLQQISAAISSRMYDRPSTDNAGLLTALGIGALAASGFQALAGDRVRRSRLAGVALGSYIVGASTIAATANYTVGLIGFFIGGFAHLTMAIVLNTSLQSNVPDEMRGRTMSYYLFGVLLGIPVGAYVLGRIGDIFSMRTAMWVDVAVLTALSCVLVGRRLLGVFDTAPSTTLPR
jgi:MFS family permease